MYDYTIQLLDYQTNLKQQYAKLADLPGFVLLESSHCIDSRYDIVSALPYDRVKLYDKSNLKSSVDSLKQELCTHTSVMDYPFQGGAIGYCSYDFGNDYLTIPRPFQAAVEGMPLLDFGLYDWAIIADHLLKKLYLFAANTQASTKAIIKDVLALWHGAKRSDGDFSIDQGFEPSMSKANYKEAFFAIQDAIKAGRCYQVNFTQAFQASYSGNCWDIYKTVSQRNPVPFSAFLRTEDAVIMSFSPERFLQYQQGSLVTSPIKGTIRRSIIPEEDNRLKQELLQSEKNRAENVMIVDLLRNDLGKIAKVGTVDVSRLCEINSFQSVHHLVSHIKALCLDALNPFEAFLSCFPGGSITGAPKLEAMRVISELEPHSRGVYCGSIGYFSRHGRFDTNIAIRSLIAKNNRLQLAAGGGIVIDSDWEEEYRECYTKLSAIRHGLE